MTTQPQVANFHLESEVGNEQGPPRLKGYTSKLSVTVLIRNT